VVEKSNCRERMTSFLHPLDASTSLELISQREFPHLASVVAGLVFQAVRTRRAALIEVSVEASLDAFTVRDNGFGMDVNLLKAVWRSVCGIADVYIETWPGMVQPGQEDQQSALYLKNGWIAFLADDHPMSSSHSSGSLVRVTELFARLPVRRRRHENGDTQREMDKLRAKLERIVLMFPHVRLRCLMGDRLVVDHSPKPNIVEALGSIYGTALTTKLVSVSTGDASAIISASREGLHHSKEVQIVLCDGQMDCEVEDLLKDCLNTAFRERSGKELLNLTSQRNRTLYLVFVVVLHGESLQLASRSQLKKLAEDLLGQANWTKQTAGASLRTVQDDLHQRGNYPETPFGADKQQPVDSKQPQRSPPPGLLQPLPKTALTHRAAIKLNRDTMKDAEFVGQVNDEFLILKKQPEGTLLIVDQHAADERVRFERFQRDAELAHGMDDIVNGDPEARCTVEIEETDSSWLAMSPLLRITKSERERLIRAQEQCESWGFRWRFENDLQVLVEKVPILHGAKLSPQALLEIVNNLEDTSKLPLPFRRLLASKACRGAIMFGQPLAAEECTRLVRELSLCWLPFQCAHGRPSIVPSATQLY